MNQEAIFNIQNEDDFSKVALEIFKHQFRNNRLYRSFCDLLYIDVSDVKTIRQIPFLPIQFFKTHSVLSSDQKIEATFTSSGTTGNNTSNHLVSNISVYQQSYLQGFSQFYGAIEDYVVLALLPNYLERKGSSLVYMVNDLIDKSNNSESGFYLHNLDELAQKLVHLDQKGQKTLLIGVSFALLDLIEKHQFKLNHTIVMETGGMKGRRKEMIRTELHALLKNGFGVVEIHSEYGMTELLSQAYSKFNEVFETPPWMKVLARDPEDALTIFENAKTGGLNIIDLANINSCSFIATQDIGTVLSKNTFKVLGRFDHSDIRGCNLMVL